MRLLPQEAFPPLHFPPPRLFFNLSHAERGWLVCNFVLHIRPFPLRSSPNSIRSYLGDDINTKKVSLKEAFFVLVIPTRLSATLLRNACSTALIRDCSPAFFRPPFACSQTRLYEFKSRRHQI